MEKWLLGIIIVSLSVFMSCDNKSELTELQIESLRANEYRDIGRTIEEIVEHLRLVESYNDLLKFIKDRGVKNNRTARKLDFDVFHLKEDIWTQNNWRINLSYIVYENKIRYGLIESIDTNYTEISGNIEFVRDEGFITKYIRLHNERYQSQKSVEDFIEEVIKENEVIKIACGNNVKVYGAKEKTLYRQIEIQNYEYVRNLLTSINPEQQTLGIIGFEKIQELGYSVSSADIEIIDQLKKRNSSILACVYCELREIKLEKYLEAYDWSILPHIDI